MPHPSLSAKIWISGPGKKSDQCLLGSPMPPVFWARGRNPSLYGHSGIGNQCKAYATILLSHQHHSITPGTLARPNGTRLQHLSQMVPNFLNHWWWDLSESFLKRNIISHLYGMLCRMSATQLCQV